jgi:Phage integrase, N-terminal SAM-like domain
MEVAELDVSTKETYESYIRRTILPALGSMDLRKLRGPRGPHEPARGAVAIDVNPTCLVVEVFVR